MGWGSLFAGEGLVADGSAMLSTIYVLVALYIGTIAALLGLPLLPSSLSSWFRSQYRVSWSQGAHRLLRQGSAACGRQRKRSMARTDPSSRAVPRHIAVIMDGNRRFGRARFADPLQGHWEGGKKLSEFTRWCIERQVAVLTVYAFSTENWKRDPLEVSTLMRIFCKYADDMKREAVERGVRVRVMSTAPERLPLHVREAIGELEEATRGGKKLQLNLCVSYGGRGEVVNACKSIAAAVASGAMKVNEIDEVTLGKHLLTADLPDPDILIRTSGEYRISNFLLFQVAYTEMVFLDKYWPQVQVRDLDRILHDYGRRERRYGS